MLQPMVILSLIIAVSIADDDTELRFSKYHSGKYHSLDQFTNGQSLKFSQRSKVSSTSSNKGNAQKADEHECTKSMFGTDQNAYLACIAHDALQTNWFPSPIAGLYLRSYLDWNGFDGFWQNGAILETFANFVHYTGSQRGSTIFQLAGRTMDELQHAYYPLPSFDDEGWYGVSYARVYEVTGNHSYLRTAEDLYDWMWSTGWDHSQTCDGGMWFGNGHGLKITITNCQMLALGAKLYRLTQKPSYLKQTLTTLDYLMKQVVNQTTYLLADSIDTTYPDTCSPLPKFNITYNSGMFIGGLVELYKGSANTTYLDIAHKVAAATIKENAPDGVLLEYCEWDSQCQNDDDAKLFKGIFVRNLRYLMDVSDDATRKVYQDFLQANIDSILAKSQCADPVSQNCSVMFKDGPSGKPTMGPVFTTSWVGPYNTSNVIAQTSALDLFVSAILPGTDCNNDPECNYSPPLPNIEHLNCTSNPCPKGYPCCTWIKLYATCCMPYQTCSGGGCYPP